MKLKLFLLSLLLTIPLFGQDCVPSSLKYLADELGEVHSLQEWIKACETNDKGTDLDKLIPAWSKMVKLEVKLVPIYVLPKLGLPQLDVPLENFRKSEVDREVVTGAFKYLWVGLHEDPQTKKAFVHCAVIIFMEDHVIMISPNSQDSDGKMLVEKLDLPTFFSHTLVVFDLEPVLPPRTIYPRRRGVLL